MKDLVGQMGVQRTGGGFVDDSGISLGQTTDHRSDRRQLTEDRRSPDWEMGEWRRCQPVADPYEDRTRLERIGTEDKMNSLFFEGGKPFLSQGGKVDIRMLNR